MFEALQLWASAVIVAAILVLFCDLASSLRMAFLRIVQRFRRLRRRRASSTDHSKAFHAAFLGDRRDEH